MYRLMGRQNGKAGRSFGSAFLVALLSLAFASRSNACACCSEQDVWQRQRIAWKEFNQAESFFADAHLDLGVGNIREQLGEADPILGLEAMKLEVRGRVELGRPTIKLTVNADTLEFTPETVERFVTDSSFISKNSCGGSNCLYKELAVHGRLTPTKNLKKTLGTGPWQAVLVLQGEGNDCSNSDMKKWLLHFEAKVGRQSVPISASGKIEYPKTQAPTK